MANHFSLKGDASRWHGLWFDFSYVVECECEDEYSEGGVHRWEERRRILSAGVMPPREEYEDRTTSFYSWEAYVNVLGVRFGIDTNSAWWAQKG